MPTFSVIIPVFNRAALVRAAIGSVLAQTCQDFEIIVVDDGSTDQTPDVLADLSDRVQVVRQENAGPGAARNTGVRHASGVYVAFLDSDDLWFPWTLATYRQVIQQYDEPAFVAGSYVALRNHEQMPAAAGSLQVRRFDDYLASIAGRSFWYGGTCGVAVRRDVLVQTGGFTAEHINAEDLDLWLRLGAAPGFVRIMAPPLFAYRKHEVSAVGDLARSFEGVRRFIRQEKAGAYPGGSARRQERLRLVTLAVRPISLACLRAGRLRWAWSLYANTFTWHLRLGRLQYLLGFPLMTLGRIVTRR